MSQNPSQHQDDDNTDTDLNLSTDQNRDQDFWLPLRGNGINPLIDVSTPLLGMALRARSVDRVDPEKIEIMRNQAINEIDTIGTELKQQQYDHAAILAHRYILCTFIDEAILGTQWGRQSVWSAHSLLVHFHKESWGGEKVFEILRRLEKHPERYKDLIECLFLLFNLGFQGRYANMAKGDDSYHKIIAHVYDTLRKLSKKEPKSLTNATSHVKATRYRLSRQIPVWSVFAGFVGLWSLVFVGYLFSLRHQSHGVLAQLSQILQ